MNNPTVFAYPGSDGAILQPKSRYKNFIGGEWTKPKGGRYFENVSQQQV